MVALSLVQGKGAGTVETYRYYPPQLRSTHMPYQVITAGAPDCEHELLELDWCDRITIQSGLVFVTFSCEKCGRQICQSLEEVLPPVSWKGGNGSHKAGLIE
jgi:hypothetical protein